MSAAADANGEQPPSRALLAPIPATQSIPAERGAAARAEGGERESAADDVSLASVSPHAGAVRTVVVTAEELVENVKESLVAQRRRQLERRGEMLTVMCIGEAGSGKTTLAQSLFVQPIPRRKIGTKSTVEIEESVVDMVMGQNDATVKVNLRMVDSPGYGDDIDVESSFKRVVDYIEDGFDRVLAMEKKAVRPNYASLEASVGVDAVLYFIAPHRLKRLDIEFLKRIHKRASVLPIISKADTMTSAELAAFRAEVVAKLASENIDTFADPFAVICCAVSSDADSEGAVTYARGREYPWGTALADDPAHSDLPLLRQTLLTDGLLDLHEARTAKFEEYRRSREVRMRRSRRGLFGSLRRLQRWAVGIAVHTLIGLAFVKGVQMKLEAAPRGGEEGDGGGELARDRARGRGFFGGGGNTAPEAVPTGRRWGRQ